MGTVGLFRASRLLPVEVFLCKTLHVVGLKWAVPKSAIIIGIQWGEMVGAAGIEPATPTMST